MPEFVTGAFLNGPQISPVDVLVRLLVALAFGLIIAAIYHFTRRNQIPSSSFPVTLLLLCVLIAMVTQVIGDSVARAFSLVGALSIVRFRTVVRDTQDTAYVIFAVIVGMAVGARSLWVASIGIGVVALAELVVMIRGRVVSLPVPEFTLRIRAGFEYDLDSLVVSAIGQRVSSHELMSMGTLKQGGGVEACYRLLPLRETSVPELIHSLAKLSGVQSVHLVRRGFEED